MADDLNKNITITVTAETDTLQQNITTLSKTIDGLLAQQKQLDAAGQQNSTTYDSLTTKIDAFQKSLKEAISQLNKQAKSLSKISTSAKTANTALGALNTQLQKTTKATGESASKLKDLNTQLNSVGQTTKQQKANIDSAATAISKHTSSTAKSASNAKDLNTQLNSVAQTTKQQKISVDSAAASIDKHALNTAKSTASAKNLNTQLNYISKATKQQKSSIDSASASISKHASSTTKSASSTKKLKTNINDTGKAFKGQATKVKQSKQAFDGHKATMDLLKTSFDQVKVVTGDFGPSLQNVAQGFNAMKSGFEVVKGGLKGIGEAIEADGFGLLLQIVQELITSFINSPTGTKVLQGAISAIGVVVNKVESFFSSIKKTIVEAFSHPIDTIKSLGKMVEENIINRFTAFGTILDGLIHLDFKKVTNGAMQAVTGVKDVIDKVGTAVNTVKTGISDTTTAMVTAFNNGYTKAGKAVDDNEIYVNQSVDRQIAKYNKLGDTIGKTYNQKHKGASEVPERGQQIDTGMLKGAGVNDTGSNNLQNKITFTGTPATLQTQSTATASVNIYKKAFKEIEADAKASAGKIATNAINTLENSIKEQAAAKVSALEKDKDAELTNTSLTSAQKLAINAKYKKQEDQIKAKAFKEEQELNIAKTLMAAALAEIKLWADPGFPGAIAQTVVLAAETAAQVAQIASQKPPAYASGGLHYSSDGRGGVLPGYSKTDNTNAYLRSGEGIVVSEAMRDPWARNLVSAINVGFGGRDFSTGITGRGFAVGGIFTDGGDANRYYNQPVNDNKNLANTIAYQMVNNFPPVYVDVKDINNQQNILAQTINRVNL